jgi:hypothetical protein
MKRTCELCGTELPEHLMRPMPKSRLSVISALDLDGVEPWECRSLERCIIRTRAKRREQVQIVDEKEHVE